MVITVSWLETTVPRSPAVMVEVPPFSEIKAGLTYSTRSGVASSSSSVNGTPATNPPGTVAVTTVLRFGSSTLLSTAVMVTESELVVLPALKVMVSDEPTV